MGAIDFYHSAALCWLRSNTTNLRQQVGWPPKPICSFEGNQRKFVAMASTIPVEQVNNGPLQVTGDSFIREHLRKLSPYQPILPFEVLSARLGRKPEDIVKLDANENPYGPPPEVMEALGSIKFPYVYPDPESRRLRAALAQDSGLEAEYILAGCGADELIDLIMRCVLDPGDKIVDCPPTFTMYEFDAAVNGAFVIKVPRNPDFSLNVEQIAEVVKQEKPKCIFLTSPNNPDGSIIDDEVLLKILDLPILVILDEAYIEFSAIESRMSWVTKHENLIVLRTFSKRAGQMEREQKVPNLAKTCEMGHKPETDKPCADLGQEGCTNLARGLIEFCWSLGWQARSDRNWIETQLEIIQNLSVKDPEIKEDWIEALYDACLAGLRVGYGAFPLSIIEYLWRAKQPYNVSVAAEISACAALQNPTYLENVKNALLKERGRLYDLLKEVPFLRPFPSHSNFILSEVTSGKDAKKLKEDLAQMGVMIRHYDKTELKGYVRVTVGKPEQTDALMKCLKKLS
ncbi:unnamed protein product [Sphenostylis stenocarpa]|uniref:histidinol-phosphate transaminase n=1 Tax=Sphenostylis stenocarpa TaxID=92480 RepID=A0AA86SFF9_9FABA|nr:unnamed protein product [Sphenostylis stenocarpa]